MPLVHRSVRRHADVVELLHLRWVVNWLPNVLRMYSTVLREIRRYSMMTRRRRQTRSAHLLLLLLPANLKLRTARVVAASSAIHAAIPPVLHCVVAASSESSRDFSPSFAHLSDHLLDQHSFLRSDRIVVEIGLQILVEALTALLRRPRLNR